MKIRVVKLQAVLIALAMSACNSSSSDKPTDGNNTSTTNSMNTPTTSGTKMDSPKAGDPTNNAGGTKPLGSGGSGAASGGGGGSTGSAGNETTGNAGMDGTGTMVDMQTPVDPRGKCKIDSGFPDDNACLLAPDPKQGMQIHIGPTDYNDPDQINMYIFHAGEEASQCINFHTPNNEEIYYQTFELSGRAGTHHIINTMYNVEVTDGGGFVDCLDGGTGTNGNIVDNLPGASKAYMQRGTVAPENEHLGRAIGPNTPSQADMHYFNFTDKDVLREFWMNIYFVPKDKVTETGHQIRGMGGLSWLFSPIAPGTDMVYQYSCPIDKDGRIIELLGHYHSHGKRFTAFLNHAGGARDKVFEMYDYLDPKTYQYDTITTNPMFSDAAAGATSGILNVKAGDSLDWECHVINDGMDYLSYVNEVKTGEMCNLWGESVGPTINCVLQ